jgi:hypothetical protein
MRSQFRSEDVVRFGKPSDCPKCPDYKTCTTMCEPVERWVNQDYKGRGSKEILESTNKIEGITFPKAVDFVDFAYQKNNDLVSGLKDPDLAQDAWTILKALRIGHKSMIFAKLYYREGKSLARIAKDLCLSSQACHFRHLTLKKEVANRLERMKIWQDLKEDYGHPHEHSTKTDISIMLFYGGLYSVKDIELVFGLSYATAIRAVSKIKSRYA